jgi:type II secretory pathway pseudopilin PulG
MDKHRRRGGFTLLELLLTLGLVVMLAGVSLGPALSGRLEDKRLDSFVHSFANDLRQARQLAISQSTPHVVQVRSNGYFLRREAYPILKTVKSVPWPAGISISTEHNDQGKDFVFGTMGLPKDLSNNTVHFRNTRGTQRNVVVSAGGRIRIE